MVPAFYELTRMLEGHTAHPLCQILFTLASFVLEKHPPYKERAVNDEQHQMSCNGGVMNVNQQGLMQTTAASGRAACRVMRL